MTNQLQLKCQEDKMVALNKMERKFTTQLAEGLQRKEQVKRDHVSSAICICSNFQGSGDKFCFAISC